MITQALVLSSGCEVSHQRHGVFVSDGIPRNGQLPEVRVFRKN